MASSQRFRVTKSGLYTTLKDEARQRLQQAVQAYEEAEGGLSITQAAWLHAVSKTMLYNRINGRRDQVSYITSKQRLTPDRGRRISSELGVTTSVLGVSA